MKEFICRLFIKDFDKKLNSAQKTFKMIESSTYGGLSHTLNDKGEKIRGYYKRPARFTNVLPTHPLVVKYK